MVLNYHVVGAAIAVQAVSSHPLLTRAVDEILADLVDVSVLPAVANEAEAMGQPSHPRLLLLDGCSLQTDLGPLAQRCRSRSPGSKFLALLPPEKGSLEDKMRLFYWGIDGFVDLHQAWRAELLQAIRCILSGQLWVPSEVLASFVKQTQALQRIQLEVGHSLTAREEQVLQLLMRHLTNKEISAAFDISERTVKFHVSNILAKLGFEDRHGLLPENFAKLKPSFGPITG